MTGHHAFGLRNFVQPAREFPATDVIGGGFRASSGGSPGNSGYNRHISNQPPMHRSHEQLDPRQLTQLARQRVVQRANMWAQRGANVYHEILPSYDQQQQNLQYGQLPYSQQHQPPYPSPTAPAHPAAAVAAAAAAAAAAAVQANSRMRSSAPHDYRSHPQVYDNSPPHAAGSGQPSQPPSVHGPPAQQHPYPQLHHGHHQPYVTPTRSYPGPGGGPDPAILAAAAAAAAAAAEASAARMRAADSAVAAAAAAGYGEGVPESAAARSHVTTTFYAAAGGNAGRGGADAGDSPVTPRLTTRTGGAPRVAAAPGHEQQSTLGQQPGQPVAEEEPPDSPLRGVVQVAPEHIQQQQQLLQQQQQRAGISGVREDMASGAATAGAVAAAEAWLAATGDPTAAAGVPPPGARAPMHGGYDPRAGYGDADQVVFEASSDVTLQPQLAAAAAAVLAAGDGGVSGDVVPPTPSAMGGAVAAASTAAAGRQSHARQSHTHGVTAAAATATGAPSDDDPAVATAAAVAAAATAAAVRSSLQAQRHMQEQQQQQQQAHRQSSSAVAGGPAPRPPAAADAGRGGPGALRLDAAPSAPQTRPGTAESFMGPLPGGSSPRVPLGRTPSGGFDFPYPGAAQAAASSPVSLHPRPHTAAAAVGAPTGPQPQRHITERLVLDQPATNRTAAQPHYPMVVREAGRAVSQSYGGGGGREDPAAVAPAVAAATDAAMAAAPGQLTPEAAAAVAAAAVAAAVAGGAGGRGVQGSLAASQGQWESSVPLEGDPAYIQYANLMAKGEYSAVPQPDFRTAVPAYGNRPATSPSPTRGSVMRGSSAWRDKRPKHLMDSEWAERRAKRDLWTARSSLAADARTQRTAARLLLSENRRLGGELASLQQSLEGLDRGTLSPDYVHVHAQSVAQRLAFLERYTPMVTGESSLAGHQRDIASVADAAAAVAAAAQAAAAAAAGTPGTGRQVADMGAGMSSGGGAGGMPYSGAAQQYEQRPATAPAAAAEAPYGGGADGYGHGGYEQGHGYGHDGRVVPYGRGRQQGRYQYVPPAELWRRRSSAAEVALRRRLGGALERSYQQTTELLVPPGADPDEVLQAVELVRHSRAEHSAAAAAPGGADGGRVSRGGQQGRLHGQQPRGGAGGSGGTPKRVSFSGVGEAPGGEEEAEAARRAREVAERPRIADATEEEEQEEEGEASGEVDREGASRARGHGEHRVRFDQQQQQQQTYSSPGPARPYTDMAAAAALAAAASAAAAVQRPFFAGRGEDRGEQQPGAVRQDEATLSRGVGNGPAAHGRDGGHGGEADGEGDGEEGQEQEQGQEEQEEGHAHVSRHMVRLLNARAAADVVMPRPPVPPPALPLTVEEGGLPPPPPPRSAPTTPRTTAARAVHVARAMHEGGASPSAVRAHAILAAMGGRKMAVEELRHDPRVSALEQLLAPPASSHLALLYMSSRRPVPHPDDFIAGTDLSYAGEPDNEDQQYGENRDGQRAVPQPPVTPRGLMRNPDALLHPPLRPPDHLPHHLTHFPTQQHPMQPSTGARNLRQQQQQQQGGANYQPQGQQQQQQQQQGANAGASYLSGLPPAGDLFMDLGSVDRAPRGHTWHHVACWSVRDSGLVAERALLEAVLAGRDRAPAAYAEADRSLQQQLNLDDPDLEERADELREQMRQEAYDQKVQQAGEDLRDAEEAKYGYVKSAPMGRQEGQEEDGPEIREERSHGSYGSRGSRRSGGGSRGSLGVGYDDRGYE